MPHVQHALCLLSTLLHDRHPSTSQQREGKQKMTWLKTISMLIVKKYDVKIQNNNLISVALTAVAAWHQS
jgi:hypothetical protein